MTTLSPVSFDTITVLTFNVCKQDEPLKGSGRDWGPIADLITSHNPDVVLLQELDGTTAKPAAPNGRPVPGAAVDRRQAERLGQALGMKISIADAPDSTVHTAIAWRSELTLVHWTELVEPPNHHGQSLAVFDHPTWAHPLTVASVHFYPRSAHRAAEECRALIEPLLKHSPLAVVGGDFNTATATDLDRGVDFATLPAHNRSARVEARPGPATPVLELDHVVRLAGLVDPAAYLYTQTQEPRLIEATGRGGLRVDRYALTSDLVEGVVDCHPVDGQGLSDHVPVLLTLALPTT
ncbi:endonuclease/exonuclease/phosphatase family protein [Nocardiopsis sp. JB363]|uniref:endonuclease/exonuclease/phosphatase family protein n=1 Tax=Nocardiopsis sp. JB363 TaxID=1434837 RepID=UPI00097B215D|nr:endonuclease/exonuclease/phosphatase family protein [Nocardiopsis sp. JB363]SIO87192.1 hypothetical protein BQ8420_15370 [Nocardiopsis sp. JB363]